MAENKEKKGHRADGNIAGKTYCSYCGLIYLNNEKTRKELKKECK